MADAAYMIVVDVYLNGEQRSCPSGILSGRALKAAADIPDDVNLWMENRTGRGDDQLLDDLQRVDFQPGDRLYTVPGFTQ